MATPKKLKSEKPETSEPEILSANVPSMKGRSKPEAVDPVAFLKDKRARLNAAHSEAPADTPQSEDATV